MIRGNQAIVGYFETLRPLAGELETGHEPHSMVKSGNLVTIMGNYVFTSGVRVTSTEVYERQADGRYKCKLDQFGLRDPLM